MRWVPSDAQVAPRHPKGTRGTPKGAQGHPKGAKEAQSWPKGTPKDAQWQPKGTPKAPEKAKVGSKGAPGHPKGAQEDESWPKGSPNGGKGEILYQKTPDQPPQRTLCYNVSRTIHLVQYVFTAPLIQYVYYNKSTAICLILCLTNNKSS